LKKSIGLDIGSQSVKLVELEKEGEIFYLTKAIYKELEGNDPFFVIKEIFLENEINVEKTPFTLTCSSRDILFKLIEILPLKKEPLEKIVSYEAQQEISVPLSELVWDYQILNTKPKTEPKKVIFTAIKKENLERILGQITHLNLRRVEYIDTEPFSLYNCLGFNGFLVSPKPSWLIELGTNTTTLIMFQKGDLWIKIVPGGSNQFNEFMERRWGVSLEEAERQKKEMNLQTDLRLEEALEKWIEEIKRNFDYYYLEREGVTKESVQEIFLSGGGSRLKGLDKFMEQRLGFKVTFLDPFKRIEITAKKIDEIRTNRQVFGIAFGLALRNLYRCNIRINFLKEILLRRKKKWQRKLLLTFLSLLAGSILAGIFISLNIEIVHKQKILKDVKNRVAIYQSHGLKIEKIIEEKEEIKRKVDLLGDFAVYRGLYLDLFKELVKQLPEQIQLNQLSFYRKGDDFILELEGISPDYNFVSNFISKLKEVKSFIQVKPLSSSLEMLEGREGVKFLISISAEP